MLLNAVANSVRFFDYNKDRLFYSFSKGFLDVNLKITILVVFEL